MRFFHDFQRFLILVSLTERIAVLSDFSLEKSSLPFFSGLISLNDWCITIEQATELKLPWRLLRPR